MMCPEQDTFEDKRTLCANTGFSTQQNTAKNEKEKEKNE